MNELELQRTVTRIALEASASSGFALAGSGAIREHGVINRMSQDVDLFTSNTNERAFGAAVDRLIDADLTEHGVDATDLDAAQKRLTGWSAQLRSAQS